MLNLDSFYSIGAAHVYCQDYGDHGRFQIKNKWYSYVIVSDGCSSSKDSDIGARLLAKSFPMCIRHLLQNENDITPKNLEIEFLETWHYKLPYAGPQGMDATVVALLHDESADELHSFIWGDGKIFYKYKNQESGYLTDITYKSNAPFYLSYLNDEDRIKAYEKQFGLDYAVRQGFILTPTNCVEIPETQSAGIKFHYEKYIDAAKTLSFASVFSDGVDTFHKKDANLTMARHVLFGELNGYKNFQGEFVKRRMMAFKKQCLRDGWIHDDDLSCATISFS